jgi:hypothetical protein
MPGDLRLANGKFAAKHCPDPNCCGDMVRDTERSWLGGPERPILRCDGLTFIDESGPLIACNVQYPAAALRSRNTDNGNE